MKSRVIRGLSLPPIRLVGLPIKRIGECKVGMTPILCSACNGTSYRRPSAQTALCPLCNNVGLGYTPAMLAMAKSVVRVERYAASMSLKIPNASVDRWCKVNVKNLRYRGYLDLSSDRYEPRLDGKRVSSRVYFNVMRFIMLNMIATCEKHLRFLERNHVNVLGHTYLRRAAPLDAMMGNSDPNEHEPRVADVPVVAFFDQLLNHRALRDSQISAHDLTAILEIYGVGSIFGDRNDTDENP